MNQMIILCTLLIVSVLSRGPCDEKLECYTRSFDTDDRALCLGYRSCLSADFGTTSYNPVCSGALACQDSTISELPAKFLCNGFKSCQGMKKGVRASEKVACNGLISCQGVIGKLEAPFVTCDGDISCVNKKIKAEGSTSAAGNQVVCNGNKACLGTNIFSINGYIGCDGDTSCKQAQLTANIVACGGKRSCFSADVRSAGSVYAYGFNALANAQITGTGVSVDEEIRALGMNAILGADVVTGTTGTTRILAYGFRAMVGAAIQCRGTSTCIIECRNVACKSASVYVGNGASITIDPAGCDPRDPGYAVSKKDPTLPAKQLGINCPSISGPGVRAEDADLTVEEWKQAHFDKFRQSVDYKEMMESADIAEQALDAMIAEKVEAIENNLDLEIPNNKEQDLMVVGQIVSSSTNHMLASNLLTALAVFIMTLVGSLCYIAYKFGGNNGETKALLQ